MIWLLVGALTLGIGLVLLQRWFARRADSVPPAVHHAPSMRDCPTCGNGISVDWAFCPFCARALAGEEIASQNNERSLPVARPGRP